MFLSEALLLQSLMDSPQSPVISDFNWLSWAFTHTTAQTV
jgi:hypothetical protein